MNRNIWKCLTYHYLPKSDKKYWKNSFLKNWQVIIQSALFSRKTLSLILREMVFTLLFRIRYRPRENILRLQDCNMLSKLRHDLKTPGLFIECSVIRWNKWSLSLFGFIYVTKINLHKFVASLLNSEDTISVKYKSTSYSQNRDKAHLRFEWAWVSMTTYQQHLNVFCWPDLSKDEAVRNTRCHFTGKSLKIRLFSSKQAPGSTHQQHPKCPVI